MLITFALIVEIREGFGMHYETKARIRILVILLLYLAIIATVDALSFDDLSYPVVLLFGLHFGLVLWVYRDAKRQEFETPILWYFAVALPIIGLFGVFAYISRRKSTAQG